jgi:signal transduction histidine kinase
MDASVSLVSQALAVEYCKVLELLPDGNGMRLRAGVGWQEGVVGQAIIEASPNTHAGYTLHSRQPVLLEDLRREIRFRGSPLLHDHNIISGLSVIIEATPNKESWNSSEANTSYRPFGVLGAHTSRRRSFSRSDVDFLQSVANVLGAAIESQQANEALYNTRAQLAKTTAALNQTTAALERRNCELDQFAYVTSHDLKAPLRAIANLSQWIEEDLSDQLNEENLHQMQLLRGRVYRLEALIEGLLQYSRAGRLKTKPERVDVEALLRQVIETLTPPAQFTIEVAPGMPTLLTERLPLQQVFTHLIDNAIKHHPQLNGRVKISVQERSDAYEFAVADDGAGIAPQFQEKVFVIFQTLKARDIAENTGIGLAIVKRIIESKGGTIRLESQEGRGATFCFAWPKPLSSS